MSLRKIFKNNVIYYRKKNNYTQEQLAELSNLSTNYIGEIERKNIKVTIDTIEQIAKAFDIDPVLLIDNKKY